MLDTIKRKCLALSAGIIFCCTNVSAQENLINNGDFERGFAGWNKFWSRSGNGSAELDSDIRHGGRQAVRIEHDDARDWSFQQEKTLAVEPGQIYKLEGWVRVQGKGTATLCVTLYDGEGEAIDWVYGGRTAGSSEQWQHLHSRFLIPKNARSIAPRLIGEQAATVWLDDMSLVRDVNLDRLRKKCLPAVLETSSRHLQFTLRLVDGTMSVLDRRTGQTWRQCSATDTVVLDAKTVDDGLDLRLLHAATMLELDVVIRLLPDRPEVLVELRGKGQMHRAVAFPQPFVTGRGTFLVMPVNEGINYPVDDRTLEPMWYHLYGGHGLCMGWYGVTNGRQGLLTIVETPDDAAVRVPRLDDLLCLSPEWMPQRGHFGPKRRLRYVFLARGGYVAMCKRYRKHAEKNGLLKTLAEKRRENPNVDMLVGAVNVWCWEKNAVEICREMHSLGIDRMLWSSRQRPEVLKKLNEMNVLTSCYDIYQDTMNPENFKHLSHVHGNWTTRAWPDDLMLDAQGDWRPGWRVKGKDGKWYACGVLCDRQALDYARRRIPPELEKHPYRSRFIDTTTATEWRECYHKKHPMTRSQSRRYKMELLKYVSSGCGLVTGSETGHEAAVPYVHYFEGMLSLGPYRVPDAGRNMLRILDEVPARVAKFQTGHYYRLPLWELVYHDCVVSQWYWGDYNNKLPSLWDRRDLLNALYGTPPMFMFDRKIWQQNRERFVRSYQTVAEIARRTGYHEMTGHRWLTDDRAVQQTSFANGVTVTVNFGEKPYTLPDGTQLESLSHHVEGLRATISKR